MPRGERGSPLSWRSGVFVGVLFVVMAAVYYIPDNGSSFSIQLTENAALRREVERLRAELAALRGGAAPGGDGAAAFRSPDGRASAAVGGASSSAIPSTAAVNANVAMKVVDPPATQDLQPAHAVQGSLDRLNDNNRGCNRLGDEKACLSSKDGREGPFRHTACHWCCGAPCTHGGNLCEPKDWLLQLRSAAGYDGRGRNGLGEDTCSATPKRPPVRMPPPEPPPPAQPQELPKEPPLKVPVRKSNLSIAFAIFITDIRTEAFRDAVAVLAFSIKKAAKERGRHRATVLALTPERLPDRDMQGLLKVGVDRVIRKKPPVDPSEIETEEMRKHMGAVQGKNSALNQFTLLEETIKYWGIAEVSYDRVLVLDADIMVLDPMDDIMDLDEDFVGVYDYGLDCCNSAMPPVQGGFLLFRPSMHDFDSVRNLTREGDFRGGRGWKGSRIGYWYGGAGPDGLLQYYYNKDALPHGYPRGTLPEGLAHAPLRGSRFRPVDRSVYDFLMTERLMREVNEIVNATNRSHDDLLASVTSVHFTGTCPKPWTCNKAPARFWPCQFFFKSWFRLRSEYAAQQGLDVHNLQECEHGHYQPLPPPSGRRLLEGYWK